MSLSIEIKWLSGRYHASDWNHNVNEGVIDWPPSPWRILRGLIATHRLKCRETDSDTFDKAVEKLADVRPVFHVPRAVEAHTRHWMPTRTEKSKKVFDAFVHMATDAPLVITWPNVDLDESARAALAAVVSKIGYLGRAESWVEAQVIADPPEPNVVPGSATSGEDAIDLVAVVPNAEFEAWRAAAVDRAISLALEAKQVAAREKGKSTDDIKLSKKAVAQAKASVPATRLAALQMSTTELRKTGWSRAPASEIVTYRRPRSLLEPSGLSRPRSNIERPTVARYAVVSQAPPLFTDSVSFAEKIHRALVKKSGGREVFTGKRDGVPLLGHGHAMYLPECNDDKGRITHLSVVARAGFEDAHLDALAQLRWTWDRSGHDIQLVLMGTGHAQDLGGPDVRRGHAPILSASKRWRSRTPFVPTRHAKTFRDGRPKCDESGLQIGSAQHDVRRLLDLNGYPEIRSISELHATTLGGRAIRWLKFVRSRKNGDGRRGSELGFGFEIEFAAPVTGPLAVGYGAHFGLGQFVPAPDGA